MQLNLDLWGKPKAKRWAIVGKEFLQALREEHYILFAYIKKADGNDLLPYNEDPDKFIEFQIGVSHHPTDGRTKFILVEKEVLINLYEEKGIDGLMEIFEEVLQ